MNTKKPFHCLCATLAILLLSACSSLIPYEDEFACNRPDNMGKCINTEDAYLEAVSGESNTPYAKPASELDSDESNHAKVNNSNSKSNGNHGHLTSNSGYLEYLDANYRETARLLDSAITPVTSSGDTIKIILVPNKITSKVMLSERTMYVIIEEPEFIMGDYLSPKVKPIKGLFGE